MIKLYIFQYNKNVNNNNKDNSKSNNHSIFIMFPHFPFILTKWIAPLFFKLFSRPLNLFILIQLF